MSNPLPAVSVPLKTLQNMRDEMVQKRGIVSSFIKHFASEIEISDWEDSMMPDLIVSYSSYMQVVEYLDKKFSDERNYGESGGIMFVEQELLLLTEVLKLAEVSGNKLKVQHNISLEVH